MDGIISMRKDERMKDCRVTWGKNEGAEKKKIDMNESRWIELVQCRKLYWYYFWLN